MIAWLIQRHRSLGDHAGVRWLETVPAQVVTRFDPGGSLLPVQLQPIDSFSAAKGQR
ncbi:hypothetical protein [Synechococcus sp. MIT S9503]|uniref:hypothetical protein n=1 Tax=Synechococcus sp. MIT S9503 TaxID=3082547 RepID=UPI0039A4009E